VAIGSHKRIDGRLFARASLNPYHHGPLTGRGGADQIAK
jgi:hypothetical protein